MKHETQFSKEPEKPEDRAQALANCYARVFLGDDDGKRVLADLRAKFGLERICFKAAAGAPYDPLAAALTDGERRVMAEIESALKKGAPGQVLKKTKR